MERNKIVKLLIVSKPNKCMYFRASHFEDRKATYLKACANLIHMHEYTNK